MNHDLSWFIPMPMQHKSMEAISDSTGTKNVAVPPPQPHISPHQFSKQLIFSGSNVKQKGIQCGSQCFAALTYL
jgi:hypothetical protein